MKRLIISSSVAAALLTAVVLTSAHAQDPPPFRRPNLTGLWRFEQTGDGGRKRTGKLRLRQDGSRITGTATLSGNFRGKVEGSVTAQTVSLTIEYEVSGKRRVKVSTWYQGALSFDGQSLEHGTYEARAASSRETGRWSASR